MKREKFHLQLWDGWLEERFKPLEIFKEPTVEENIQRKLYPKKEYPYLYNKDYVKINNYNL